MEPSIIIPHNHFDFSALRLADPVSVSSGTYFTRLYNNDLPLYVQSPKCSTKQGFVRSPKKIYSDLVLNSTGDEYFVQWLVDLETKCTDLIYQNSNDWFQTPLELSDIESSYNSIIKVNKTSGYSVRTNVRLHTMTKEPVIRIYNQSEGVLTMDDVKAETNVITILEIQGVKFTTRNFQLEVEVKQVMVLEKDMFDTCLIKPAYSAATGSAAKPNTLGQLTSEIEEPSLSDNGEGGAPDVVDSELSLVIDDIEDVGDLQNTITLRGIGAEDQDEDDEEENDDEDEGVDEDDKERR